MERMTLLYKFLCQQIFLSERALFGQFVIIICFILVFEDVKTLTKTGDLLCITICICMDSSAHTTCEV